MCLPGHPGYCLALSVELLPDRSLGDMSCHPYLPQLIIPGMASDLKADISGLARCPGTSRAFA